MRRLIGVSALIKKRGLRCSGGIGLKRIDGLLRMANLDRCGRKRLQQRLAHGSSWVIALDGLQHFVSISVAPQSALRLSRPVKRVLAEQRVILCFEKPAHCLPRAVLHIVVIAERKRGARAPDVRGVMGSEG